ncbi:MAG: dTMP kinase [Lactobacillales bacterium]|jgi:dTMP kinase|nr:dTMP kinase [Lactobacillales bacterium]
MTKGLFITFEGGEGTGKSTQIKLARDYFESLGREVVQTREPGGTSGAEEIRALLLKGGKDRWDKITEILLFSAARRDHLQKLILPAIAAGKIVLSDRYADSTMAYQGYGYGADTYILSVLKDLYKIIAGDFVPDLTVILDIDPKIGVMRSMKRAGNDEQRFENMQVDFHENLRRGFLEIARENPGRCAIVSADAPIEKVHESVIAVFKERL